MLRGTGRGVRGQRLLLLVALLLPDNRFLHFVFL
jgi:hypothetical protein